MSSLRETPQRIKVRVSMTIDLDLDAYRRDYGETDRAVIREDMRAAALDCVQQTLAPDCDVHVR